MPELAAIVDRQAERAPPEPARTISALSSEASRKLNARPAVVAQRAAADRLSTARVNRTGLPDGLKAGVEALSGIALDDVRVHRNSSEPAQLQAHAFAQGTDIHLAPGQDHHLPHEAWHVVQQKQGRVPATRQLKSGIAINDDAGLEAEADAMGARAASMTAASASPQALPVQSRHSPVQRVLDIGDARVAVADIPADVSAGERTVIERWINGAPPIALASWAAAQARAAAIAWLDGERWTVAVGDIVDPALTAQNCHGLTFGEDFLSFDTIGEFLARWRAAGSPHVLLCLEGTAVAHSATAQGDRWLQKLPEGPTFLTGLAELRRHYTCYDLSSAAQRAAVRQVAATLNQDYADDRRGFIGRCDVLIVQRPDKADLVAYATRWRAEARDERQVYTPQNASWLEGRDEELTNMER